MVDSTMPFIENPVARPESTAINSSTTISAMPRSERSSTIGVVVIVLCSAADFDFRTQHSRYRQAGSDVNRARANSDPGLDVDDLGFDARHGRQQVVLAVPKHKFQVFDHGIRTGRH